MTKKQNYGKWCKNPEILSDWSASDYWINNREIYYNSKQILPIKQQSSEKNIMIILTLYALCDLTIENPNKDYFNMKEIADTITNKLNKYKVFIRIKGLYIIERINKAKHKRANAGYNYFEDLNKQEQSFIKYIDDYRFTRMHDLYYAIAMLKPFIDFKLYTKSKEYNTFSYELNSSVRVLYYLNFEGKKLLKKYQKQKYLF